MEKQKESHSSEETLEHTVTIIGKVRKIRLEKNKRVADLIAAIRNKFREELKNFSFNNTTNVVLNGRVIKMNEKGELEENPILTKSSTISLMPQITGGDQ